MSDLVTGLFET